MTNDLKFSLAELADADAPPSTIDIDKARHDGRRQAVVGRLAPIGTGVAVVAACGIAVSGMVGGSAAKQSAPAGGSNATTQTQAPAKTTGFTGTDPLHAHVRFGPLPAGWQWGETEDGADYGNHTAAFKGSDPTKDAFASIQITDQRRGPDKFGPNATSQVASVPGLSKAEYITVPADGIGFKEPMYHLQWQTAAGTWAVLSVSHAGSADAAKALMDSLAAGAVVGDTEVPLPLHVDGLPKDFPAYSQELNVPGLSTGGKKAFSVDLVFGSGGRQVLITAETTGPSSNPYTKAPEGAAPPPPPSTPTVKPDRACKDDNGLTVCVTTQVGVLDSVGGAKGLLDHITSLGTDRANWTTHVIG